MKKKILIEYSKKEQILKSFKDKLRELFETLLASNNLQVHKIEARVKSKDSLEKKIDIKQEKYADLSEITDVIGIRVVTFLASDVDIVANLVKNEFEYDEENSIDKRELSADQFGYKSLHLVCYFSENRVKLSEYKAFSGQKFEIQIRSILQHAWAEIEHDLGYKAKSAIPKDQRRNFNRLAALLETADLEFDRLKRDLEHYQSEIPRLIAESPESVSVDKVSIIEINATNEILQQARELVDRIVNVEYKKTDTDDYESIVSRFRLFDISTIKDLEDSLVSNKEEFLSFVTVFSEYVNEDTNVDTNDIAERLNNGGKLGLPESVPIYYFQHFLASQSKNTGLLKAYFNYPPINISVDNGDEEKFIGYYEEAIRRLKST